MDEMITMDYNRINPSELFDGQKIYSIKEKQICQISKIDLQENGHCYFDLTPPNGEKWSTSITGFVRFFLLMDDAGNIIYHKESIEEKDLISNDLASLEATGIRRADEQLLLFMNSTTRSVSEKMKRFSNFQMDFIFKNFKENVKSKGSLCNLKAFTFQGNITPDYSDEWMQQYYLLRYFPAYLTEYYLIYKEILESDFIDRKYFVLSLGSGCGIDYWGLKFARDEFRQNIKIDFWGFDRVEWKYQYDFNVSEYKFKKIDISNFVRLKTDLFNIIIFPKFIGEIDDHIFNHLIGIIRNTDFSSKKIILINSMRLARRGIDEARMLQILNLFTQFKNYDCVGESANRNYADDTYLHEISNGFEYPGVIRDYLKNLKDHCVKHNLATEDECNCVCDCHKNLNRFPITKATQLQYQIYKLERRAES